MLGLRRGPVHLWQEREDVRRRAIFLYGDVIYSGGSKYQEALKNHAFQSLVPLLFHLADSCPEVVTVSGLAWPLAGQHPPDSPGVVGAAGQRGTHLLVGQLGSSGGLSLGKPGCRSGEAAWPDGGLGLASQGNVPVESGDTPKVAVPSAPPASRCPPPHPGHCEPPVSETPPSSPIQKQPQEPGIQGWGAPTRERCGV